MRRPPPWSAARERLAAAVPVPVRQAWVGRIWGPALRTVLVAAALPLGVNLVFARNPPFGILLNGLVIGSLYSLMAVGMILVHRANRIISFAQAGLGATPAVVALVLYTEQRVPYPLVLVALLASAAVLGALVDVLVIRRFRRSPRLILTVATIGVAQLLAFVEFMSPTWISGETLPPMDFETPFSGRRTEIGGVFFTGDHLVTVATVALLLGGLAVFLRRTRLGIAVRASAENGPRALLVGIPVLRVSTAVWIIAALLSAIGVFLRAPLVGLPIGGLIGPSILLYTLTVAVLARMTNLPLALGAGMALGVLDQSIFYATRNPNVSLAIMLPVILVALLVERSTIARAQDSGQTTWPSVKEFKAVPAQLIRLREVKVLRSVLAVAAGALVLAAPYLVGELRRNQLSIMAIYALIGVSLVILTGWAGQISLGQFAFTGVGAAVGGLLAADHHADFFVAVTAAGLVGAGLAVVVGLPALRVQGFFLAVTTLAFAATTQSFFLNRRYFDWLLPDPSNPVTRPVFFGRIDASSDQAYYYVCVVALALVVLVARSVRSSRTGRLLMATRDNPRAAQAYGVNVARTRLVAFALSGFMAGLAGGLYAHMIGSVDAGAFPPTTSIQLFAMTVIGGLTSVSGAVAGAVYVVGFQYLLPRYALLATGAGLLVLLLFFPGGLSEVGFRLRDAFLRWVADRNRLAVPDALVADDETVVPGPDDITALTAGAQGGALLDGRVDYLICPVCGQDVPADRVADHEHVGVTAGAKAP